MKRFFKQKWLPYFIVLVALCSIFFLYQALTDAPPRTANTNTIGIMPSIVYQFPLIPSSRILLEKDDLLFSRRAVLDTYSIEQTRAILPMTVDHWSERPLSKRILVDDQGSYGSCTAHALSYAFQLWALRGSGRFSGRPSRAYWYALSRILLGEDLRKDRGSTNSATLLALAQYGFVHENTYAYSGKNIFAAPPAALTKEGSKTPLRIARRIGLSNNQTSNEMVLCTELAQGKTIIIGILVFSSFMWQSSLRSGNIPVPNTATEKVLGGHAIALTGYDTRRKRFLFRNSWGSRVGDKGHFTLPYSYATNPNLVGDIWSF
jgi:C1A family cysteine protease